MSKISDLRYKYSATVTQTIFNSFVDADTTETKKYVDYMCKMWSDRNINGIKRSYTVVELVNSFNDVINYLVNKDIYSPEYKNLPVIQARISEAHERKLLKEFDKSKHGTTIYETDNLLIIRPLTQDGSNKWGANTKWCTTGKKDSRFAHYFKTGILLYVLDKKNQKKDGVNKLALYINLNRGGLSNAIEVYDQFDRRIDEKKLMKNGWSQEELILVFNFARIFIFKLEYIEDAKESVVHVLNVLKSIDIKEFSLALDTISTTKDDNSQYIEGVKNGIENMIETLKQII